MDCFSSEIPRFTNQIWINRRKLTVHNLHKRRKKNRKMDNIITSIPSLLLYAVPGFFGVSILRKLTHRQIKGDFLWVESIGISALSVAFVRSICSAFGNGITENSLWIWCVVLNVATATGMAQIFRCPKFATFMVRHFSISFLDGILPNAIDWVNGSEVYLKLKLREKCGVAQLTPWVTLQTQRNGYVSLALSKSMKITNAFGRLLKAGQMETVWSFTGKTLSIFALCNRRRSANA